MYEKCLTITFCKTCQFLCFILYFVVTVRTVCVLAGCDVDERGELFLLLRVGVTALFCTRGSARSLCSGRNADQWMCSENTSYCGVRKLRGRCLHTPCLLHGRHTTFLPGDMPENLNAFSLQPTYSYYIWVQGFFLN